MNIDLKDKKQLFTLIGLSVLSIIVFIGIVLIIFSVFFSSPKITPIIETPPTINPASQQELPIIPTQIPAYIEKIKKEPFWNMLPHWGDDYKIEYKGSAEKIIIYTTSTALTPELIQSENQKARDAALGWIRSNGGNPEELTIEFIPDEN